MDESSESEHAQIEIYDLDEQVWHARLAGYTFTEISHRFEISTAEAVARFREFTVELAKDVSLDKRAQMVALDLQRLDMMQREHFKYSVAGDTNHTKAMLGIMSHRAKLLQLDRFDPSTEAGRQAVLIVSGDREAFIEALQAGRRQLSGPSPDDGVDEEDG